MVNFNELRITPDGKSLIVDVSVPDYTYYEDISLSKIVIDTQETFQISGPSNKNIYNIELNGAIKIKKSDCTLEDNTLICNLELENYNIYDLRDVVTDSSLNYRFNGVEYSYSEINRSFYMYEDLLLSPYKVKDYRVIFDYSNFQHSINDNMFFIYVYTEGNFTADTPCGMDNRYTLGTVVNMYPIYRESINYLKQIDNDCNIPKGLIDLILRVKGVELALKTGNYLEAINLWKLYIKKYKSTITSKCKCNGTF